MNDLLSKLPFKIGDQYEDYEFSLESHSIEQLDHIQYDVYKYMDDDLNTIFDVEVNNGILMYFNADILSAVQYRFREDCFDSLLGSINILLPARLKIRESNLNGRKRALGIIHDDIVIFLLVCNNMSTTFNIMNRRYYLAMMVSSIKE